MMTGDLLIGLALIVSVAGPIGAETTSANTLADLERQFAGCVSVRTSEGVGSEVTIAFSLKREQPWIWLLLSSLITLLLGLLILARWPISSVYVLGIFLGIDLVMAGAGWIGLSLALHRRGEPTPAKP